VSPRGGETADRARRGRHINRMDNRGSRTRNNEQPEGS
jgi:hypothetical protein